MAIQRYAWTAIAFFALAGLTAGLTACSTNAEGTQEVPGIPAPGAKAVERDAFGQKIEPTKVFKGNHIASGVSLRNRGGGVINLRGAPDGAQVLGAFLYWDILDREAPDRMTVSLNGAAVVGSLVGRGDSPCWSPPFNFAYRAEVPGYLLYAGINGDYKVAGFPSSLGTGSNPWASPGSAPLAEGATLVVFYRAENEQRTTYVYDSPVSGTEFSANFSATLTGFNAPSNSARFTLVGADGQTGFGLQTLMPTTMEKSFFQGTQIAGPGGTNNDSDWNGQDTEPLSQLWDTRTQIVPIERGSTSAEVRYEAGSDCLVVVAFFLSV